MEKQVNTINAFDVGNIFNGVIKLQNIFIEDHLKWIWKKSVLRYIAARYVVLQYKPVTINYSDDKVTIKQHMRLVSRNKLAAIIVLKRKSKALNSMNDK